MSAQPFSEASTPTPRDGYGAGYLVSGIASDFHALCRLIGPEAARQELAEVINAEFERNSRHGTKNHARI